MKDERIIKSFTALSFDGNAVTGEPAPATSTTPAQSPREEAPRDGTTKPDDFRDMLYQRYTAPYALSARYRFWGINE